MKITQNHKPQNEAELFSDFIHGAIDYGIDFSPSPYVPYGGVTRPNALWLDERYSEQEAQDVLQIVQSFWTFPTQLIRGCTREQFAKWKLGK